MNNSKVELDLDRHKLYIDSIEKTNDKKTNIVLIFVDDMGHGDISCFGSKAINTPNLDKLADEGVKMNNFYASSPVCSPSRFSCLTGRYPTRGFVNSVFFPSKHSTRDKILNSLMFPHGIKGILPDEITIAEALKASGYKTGIFGKWHLGDTSPNIPNDKGFDYFYGAHYSNDMTPYSLYKNRDIDVLELETQDDLTIRLTDEIVDYIDKSKENPFFLYYASPFPHDPVSASDKFKGTSNGGLYGDCVQELDWSVGQIVEKLKKENIYEDTLIVFTSDNGPWYEGDPGRHRGRKGNNFDGGQMVPFIACWPNGIEANRTIDMPSAMNIDFFPTFLTLAGIDLPTDRIIDGKDMMPLLKGETNESLHDDIYFIKGKKVFGCRDKDNYKYMIKAKSENTTYSISKQGPFLFDLNYDQMESYNVIDHFQDKGKKLLNNIENMQKSMEENPRGWIKYKKK